MLKANQLRSGFQAWQRFAIIFSAVRRVENLDGLARWAKRKRLRNRYNYYNGLYQDADTRLWRYTLRYPGMTEAARWAYAAYRMLFEPSRYRRGAAARWT